MNVLTVPFHSSITLSFKDTIQTKKKVSWLSFWNLAEQQISISSRNTKKPKQNKTKNNKQTNKPLPQKKIPLFWKFQLDHLSFFHQVNPNPSNLSF